MKTFVLFVILIALLSCNIENIEENNNTIVKDTALVSLFEIEPELRFIINSTDDIANEVLFENTNDSMKSLSRIFLIKPFARECVLLYYYLYRSSGKIIYYEIDYQKLNNFYFKINKASNSDYIQKKLIKIVNIKSAQKDKYNFNQILYEKYPLSDSIKNTENTFFDGAILYLSTTDTTITLNSPFPGRLIYLFNRFLQDSNIETDIKLSDYK